MKKVEIIEKLANEKAVEKIVKHYSTEYPDDLAQIVYLYLLEKDDNFIQELYERGELLYYASSIVWTQLSSDQSRYYYHTKKFQADTRSIDDKYDDFLVEEDSIPEQLIPIREYLTEDEWNFLLDVYELSGLHDIKDERLALIRKYNLRNRKAVIYKRNKIFKKLKKNFDNIVTVKKKDANKPKPSLWIPINQYDMNGNLIATYNSLKEAENATGVNQPNISANLRGKTKTAGKFVWKYVNNNSDKKQQ